MHFRVPSSFTRVARLTHALPTLLRSPPGGASVEEGFRKFVARFPENCAVHFSPLKEDHVRGWAADPPPTPPTWKGLSWMLSAGPAFLYFPVTLISSGISQRTGHWTSGRVTIHQLELRREDRPLLQKFFGELPALPSGTDPAAALVAAIAPERVKVRADVQLDGHRV